MASAISMMQNAVVRLLIVAHPGGGKTGSLAPLANAGFKLRIIDFDGNPESLLHFTKPECLKNIDVMHFEDQYVEAGSYMAVKGTPTAFSRSVKALDSWRYKDPEGREVDEKTGERYTNLGASKEWGADTIVVLDGVTGQGHAAFARSQAMMNKTPLNNTRQVWGAAINDQINFAKRLTSKANKHHVIVISHLKMVGPKDIEQSDDPLTKELKERAAELVQTRWYPNALGQGLPTNYAGLFPVCIEIGAKAKAGSREMKRRFQVHPRNDLDLKVPLGNLEKLGDLGVEDGLLKLFIALGAKPPSGEKPKS